MITYKLINLYLKLINMITKKKKKETNLQIMKKKGHLLNQSLKKKAIHYKYSLIYLKPTRTESPKLTNSTISNHEVLV